MADLRGAPKSSTLRRWVSLIFVFANCAFIVDFAKLADAPLLTALLAVGGKSLVPSAFLKVLVPVVLAALVAFYGAALWPHKRTRTIYDRLILPLAITAMLASCYVVAIALGQLALATALNAAALGVSAVLFARVSRVSPGVHSGWLRVPFALLCAALTIALLFTTAPWWVASLEGGAYFQQTLAIGLVIAALAAGWIAIRAAEPLYPAVLALAAGAIHLTQRAAPLDGVAYAALFACIGLFAIAAMAAAAHSALPRHDPRRRPSASTRGEPAFIMEPTTSIMRY